MAEPVKPKSREQYLDIVRETTPETYHQKVLDPEKPEAAALYRALARTHAFFARRGYEVAQAQYFRTHSTADAPPASSYRYASGVVQVRRGLDLQDDRYTAAEAMILEGPGGRSWHNAEAVSWKSGEQVKDILFVAREPGQVGNIDHLADDAGLITVELWQQPLDLPNIEPDLQLVHHANLSEGRTGIAASIIAPDNFKTFSRIRDNGRPDQFSATNRGIYIRIDDASNPENIGRLLRVARVVFPGVELPMGSGLYPHEVEVDDLPLFLPLLAAKLDNGGVFTDFTAEAAEDTPDDVELLPAVPVVNDAFYFGASEAFLGIAVAITTPRTGDITVVWEIYDGGSWVPYPGIVDDTQAFLLKGEFKVEAPAFPVFWSTNVVDGVAAFWLRARVTAVTVPGNQPLAAKILGLKPNRLLLEDDSVQWSMLDWKDLKFELTRIEAFSGGRDNTLGLLGEERGMQQNKDESDDDFRERIANLADVVTPAAINRAINRALAPYLFRGIAHDVQDGMTGLFLDAEDAFDFYTPGDLFPVDQFKLLYTDALAYGGFEVLLPYISDGEFGCAMDQGPIIYLEDEEEFLGPALDCCFLDGFPVKAAAIYSGIYQTLMEIKMFPIDFIMIRSLAQNVPVC